MKIRNLPAYLPRGRPFEEDVLGQKIFFTTEQIDGMPWLPFETSLALAEAAAIASLRNGVWDPQRPKTFPAFQLLDAVQSALRLTPRCTVELVNTLGTILDVKWCVDCFFRLEKEPRIIATVDLTTRPGKSLNGDSKADFLLTPRDLYPNTALNAFAQKVANLLRKRYKAQQHAR